MLIGSWTWRRWGMTATRPTISRTRSGHSLSCTSFATSASTHAAPSRTPTSRSRTPRSRTPTSRTGSRCAASPSSTSSTWSCPASSSRSFPSSASTSQATPARRFRWASWRHRELCDVTSRNSVAGFDGHNDAVVDDGLPNAGRWKHATYVRRPPACW